MASKYLHIKGVSLADWSQVVDWQRNERWDLGIGDETCYFNADSAGFYMGYQGGKAVSSMSVVKFGDAYSHVGHFLVEKDARRKGIGLETWQQTIQRVEATACSGLDSVVEQKANYEKWGYVEAYRIFRLQGAFAGAFTRLEDGAVSTVSHLNLTNVIKFDESCVGYNRDGLLSNWFTGPGRNGWIYEHGGGIAALFGARSSTGGVRLGPVYARDSSLFSLMMAYVAGLFPRHTLFTIDMPEFSSDEISWLKQAGFKELFYTYRMFRGGAPVERKEFIKAIASLDVG